MGFRRRGVSGTTSLAIVVPGDGVDPKRPGERTVSLGQLVGRLRTGTSRLMPTPEDTRNIAKPVKALSYGAFGSYAPSYDSTFATITKEESSLIYSTYNTDSLNAQTERLLNYAKENDYALVMADSLVELLGGGSSHTAQQQQQQQQIQISSSEQTSLASLSQLGIDTSFLQDYGEKEDEVEKQLNESWGLLGKLHQEQTRRLSLPNPPHHPSNTELAIVDRVTKKLTELAKEASPGALAPVPAIRKAMRLPTDV